MNVEGWIAAPERRLDIVAGVVDGILTTLTLTAAKLLGSGGESISMSLALRVSAAAGLTTVFAFFLAHYAQLRAELVRAERELNVTRHGRLARSNLGRQILIEALADAVLAAVCSILGALIPLGLILFVPMPGWVGCALAIAILGALGAALARTFYGSPLRWGASLMVAGVALAYVGTKLDIAG
jgi:VIT1/CCC1 family predicted Fe2+/Mn2+ transporter